MRLSTISKQSSHDRLAVAIGREVHRRRGDARLSQAALGAPLTRAFVCAVERGRTVPSITALGILLGRLDIDFDEFFRGVQQEMTVVYTPPHGDRQEAPSRRRR
jgi:transcriptional regulator with XRE-family HTH domain